MGDSQGKKRVLIVSDPAYHRPESGRPSLSNTGFAIATGQIIEGFLADSRFDVAHFARGYRAARAADPGYRVWIPPLNDFSGYEHYLGLVMEQERPDVVLIEADPVSITDWRKTVQVRQVPNLVHMPTEGGPLTRPWSETMKEILAAKGAVTTYTRFSAKVVEEAISDWNGDPLRPVEALPLGLEHANFRKYDKKERDWIRNELGWKDKFIVINVARNAGRKMWPRLFEAIRMAKESIPNLMLYAHCAPFENYNLAGHNLIELRRRMKAEEYIQFTDQLRDPTNGIGYERRGNIAGLIDIYNAADLFVSTSGAEGWNLGACEAAACGLPVVVPMYSGGWEAAQKFAIGIPVPEESYDTHPSGLRMALVRPSDVADVIVSLARREERRRALSEQGLRVTRAMCWQPTVERLIELAWEIG